VSAVPPDIPSPSLLVTRWLQFRRIYASGPARQEIMRRYAELIAVLCEHDLGAAQWARARLAIITELTSLEDILWPPLFPRRGRRAPSLDGRRIPDAPPESIPLGGVHLRRVCIELLRRHGAQTLVDLHRLLHLHGYVIAAPTQAKTLADAMAFEVESDRARRVRRGVYEALEDEPTGVEVGHPWIHPPEFASTVGR